MGSIFFLFVIVFTLRLGHVTGRNGKGGNAILQNKENNQVSAGFCLSISRVQIFAFDASFLEQAHMWMDEQYFFNFFDFNTVFDRQFLNELVFPYHGINLHA